MEINYKEFSGLLKKVELFANNPATNHHILLSDIPNNVIFAANLNFENGQTAKANELIVKLAKWLKRDIYYFISFKENARNLYAWDVACSLQLLGKLIDILQTNHQIDLTNNLIKDYRDLNILYSQHTNDMRMSA